MSKVKVGQTFTFNAGFSVEPKREVLDVHKIDSKQVILHSHKTQRLVPLKRRHFNHYLKMGLLRKEVANA